MAKTKISEFDSTPANNTDIDNINIAEGCAPSGINNAIRELMSQLKDQQTGASGDNFTVGGNLSVTGATTFTGAVVMSTALPVTSGGIGSASITANSVILGNGSSALSGNLVAPGTSGNLLTSNGTTWQSTSAPAAAFSSGTRLIFAQTSAPSGWTKDTTNYDNHALRVVTGTASTGGSINFTTAFASGLSSGATTLTTAQLPSHTHPSAYKTTVSGGGFSGPFGYTIIETGPSGVGGTPDPTGSTGDGGSHTHTIPSFAVKYLDVITATKD
jgi:hypothetical protein